MVGCLFAICALVATSCSTPERPVFTETTLPSVVPADDLGLDEAVADSAASAEPLSVVESETEPDGEDSEPTESDAPDCLRARPWVGQLVNVLATQDELAALEPLAARGEIGSVTVLGTPNSSIGSALRRLDDAGPVRVLAASDEEGGVVQRLGDLITPLDSAATQATRPSVRVRDEFAAYGQAMGDLGFDIAFAPVVDVGSGPGIGDRSYSSDPAIVTEYAAAVADGLTAAGIQPVFKHFPGHGRATGDSHLGLPTTPPFDDMAALDLVPYETLLTRSDAAVMVGHLIVPGLSDDVPTSLSSATITQLLRGADGASFEDRTFGFQGLVFVDALNMGAITENFGANEAAVLALGAGADVVILGGVDDVGPTIDSVFSAIGAGEISWAQLDASVERVLALKDVTGLRRCS